MLMSAERVGLALGESDLRAKIFSQNSKFFEKIIIHEMKFYL